MTPPPSVRRLSLDRSTQRPPFAEGGERGLYSTEKATKSHHKDCLEASLDTVRVCQRINGENRSRSPSLLLAVAGSPGGCPH